MNRLQLALNVPDLEKAIDFYSRAFGISVNKRKERYANFVIEDPAVKLVLFEVPGSADRLNHLGVEVFDDADIAKAGARLEKNGLEQVKQDEETCCFATQNKVITHAPDGTMWEWYRVLEDSDTFGNDFTPRKEPQKEVRAGGCC